MSNKNVIGIDLGATNIRGSRVTGNDLSAVVSRRIKSDGDVEVVLQDIYEVIEELRNADTMGIGIGVPSVVDVEEGIVYDVQFIRSWKVVRLKELLESRFQLPAFVNNDANCFALGEHYFGKGQHVNALVGLTLGTGLGAGIIINHKLYAGANCGAGEFGCLDYRGHTLEYYCSGSFFTNVHGIDGEQAFQRALKGEEEALALFNELGTHVGDAIKIIMYAYDPQLVVLGGSVKNAFPFFKESMWKQIRTFDYKKSAERIQIETSDLHNSGILGAAALYFDATQ